MSVSGSKGAAVHEALATEVGSGGEAAAPVKQVVIFVDDDVSEHCDPAMLGVPAGGVVVHRGLFSRVL